MFRMSKYFIALSVVAVLAVIFTGILQSQESAKVAYVMGNPKIMKAGQTAWEDCRLGMIINNADRIKTLTNEVVEIAFFKDRSNIVRIESSADVFIKLAEAPYSIELLNGSAMALIKNLPNNSAFEVRTPAGIAGARGTGWRSVTDGNRAAFDVFEDSIYAKGIDKSGNPMEEEVEVESGWRVSIDKFEKPSKLEKLTGADMDRWESWRGEIAGRNEMDSRDRLDRVSRIEDRQEDREEALKEDVNEARDIDRIVERSTASSSASSSSDPYKTIDTSD